MKLSRFSLNDLKIILQEKGYFIRMNKNAYTFRLVFVCPDGVDLELAYLTMPQFLNLDLVEYKTTFSYDYYKLNGGEEK